MAKTRKNPADPFNGAPLTPGNPGNKGGAGRPRNEWREFCRGVLSDPDTQKAIKVAAKNPKSKAFASVLRLCAAYAEGQPPQVVTHEGGITLTHDERKQRLEWLLADRLSGVRGN